MRHACSSDSKTSRHHSPQNFHSETEVLFTMSRERAEDGNQGGGRRTMLSFPGLEMEEYLFRVFRRICGWKHNGRARLRLDRRGGQN